MQPRMQRMLHELRRVAWTFLGVHEDERGSGCGGLVQNFVLQAGETVLSNRGYASANLEVCLSAQQEAVVSKKHCHCHVWMVVLQRALAV